MWFWITVGLVALALVVWVAVHKLTNLGSVAERHQAVDPETAQALRDAQQEINIGKAYGRMF